MLRGGGAPLPTEKAPRVRPLRPGRMGAQGSAALKPIIMYGDSNLILFYELFSMLRAHQTNC